MYGSALPPTTEEVPNDHSFSDSARNRNTATTPQQPAYSGAGVRVYVLDSGIQSDHDEFSATNNVQCLDTGGEHTSSCDDPWGHGTHVAALIGGQTYGVAPDVELIAIPVLGADTRARFSEVLAALDHIVVAEQQAHTTAEGTTSRAIVNLSLGTPRVATILNMAVQRTVEGGIPVIVAAGNGATDACAWYVFSHSQQLEPDLILTTPIICPLGLRRRPWVPLQLAHWIDRGTFDLDSFSSSISDFPLTFSLNPSHRYNASNFGPCVDLYAPGEHITSAWKDNTLNTITGTSSASPFITGIAALYLQRDPFLTPAELLQLLLLREGITQTDPTAVMSVPETLRPAHNSTSDNAMTHMILDNEVVNAARTFIQDASATTDVPTMTPTVSSEHWFEQIRETVQLRFWNNKKGGE